MLNSRIPALRNQALIGIGLFLLGLWAAWKAGGTIAAGNLRTLELAALGAAACGVAAVTLHNWRTGFYLFLVWMTFEDLPRKYLGNGTALFFGKDILLALVYISFYIAVRKGRVKTFRPPFLFFLSLFFWLAALQVFNQNSPSILYGLLGMKLWFYYVPLIFVGYALIGSDEDLRKFLALNLGLGIMIGGLGIAQAVLGNSFLNPAHLDPSLQDLGDLTKMTPISGQIFSLPVSVFVSTGRFALYVIVAFILAVGTAAYLLLYTRKSRKLAFVAIAVIGGATLFSGSRTAVTYVLASLLVLTVGFLWGAPWRWRQAHRLVKAIRRSFIVAALGLAAILLVFPEQAGSRIDFYTETLLPSSSAYELTDRGWDYPIYNLVAAFEGHWLIGNGTGTASLGAQYVARLLGQRPPNIWVEEGYGNMIVEMGILAPFLWLLWSSALVYYCWRVVRRLRQTRFFPMGFAIVWYAFVLLFPLTYLGTAPYQNYICNAYLWLLVGILFRLPEFAANPQAPAPFSPRAARGGLQF